MADKSRIEWTDATWNPIRGCSRVSEGCRHCYAETVAARFSGPGLPYAGLAQRVTRPDGTREARWTNEVAYAGDKVLRQPMHWREPRRIFVNSMSDLFHENVADEIIDRIFAVMALCPQHTFQILTKRPERMRAYLSDQREAFGTFDRIVLQMMEHTDAGYPTIKATCEAHGIPFTQPRSAEDWWPLRNVWLGVSVEDQATADERIPDLLATPAAIRFVSAEPLLGPVRLNAIDTDGDSEMNAIGGDTWEQLKELWRDSGPEWEDDFADWYGIDFATATGPAHNTIDWVIVGGESGPGARALHPDWARSLRDQCAAADVPFFFKQWGEWLGGMFHLDLEDWLQFENLELTRFYSFSDKTLSQHWDEERSPEGLGSLRVGKAKAGRLLDGVEHNAFPEAPAR